jgi:hypothetical protein
MEKKRTRWFSEYTSDPGIPEEDLQKSHKSMRVDSRTLNEEAGEGVTQDRGRADSVGRNHFQGTSLVWVVREDENPKIG